MTGDSRNELASLLGDLAIEMQSQTDSEATLQSIVHGAVDVVPGTRWAGVSQIEGRSVVPRVPTDPMVAELDQVQAEFNDGPCLSALREHRTVLIDDMTTEQRWPRFAEAALERGVKSLLSFQLFVRKQNLGALNLYAGEAGVFADDSIFIGELLAQHASVALVGSNAELHFDSALASRDVIGQAKGILMHRERLTGEQAFALLVKTSQNAHIKLVDIARWVVDQHNEGLGRT